MGSATPKPPEFLLQLADPSVALTYLRFGLDASLPLIIKRHYVTTSRRVEPLKLTIMPPYVEVQHVAVALKDVFRELLDWNRPVFAIHQAFTGQVVTS